MIPPWEDGQSPARLLECFWSKALYWPHARGSPSSTSTASGAFENSWFDVSCQAIEVSRSGCGTLSDLQLAMTGAIAATRIGVN
jgi:hypothetical protein